MTFLKCQNGDREHSISYQSLGMGMKVGGWGQMRGVVAHGGRCAYKSFQEGFLW